MPLPLLFVDCWNVDEYCVVPSQLDLVGRSSCAWFRCVHLCITCHSLLGSWYRTRLCLAVTTGNSVLPPVGSAPPPPPPRPHRICPFSFTACLRMARCHLPRLHRRTRGAFARTCTRRTAHAVVCNLPPPPPTPPPPTCATICPHHVLACCSSCVWCSAQTLPYSLPRACFVLVLATGRYQFSATTPGDRGRPAVTAYMQAAQRTTLPCAYTHLRFSYAPRCWLHRYPAACYHNTGSWWCVLPVTDIRDFVACSSLVVIDRWRMGGCRRCLPHAYTHRYYRHHLVQRDLPAPFFVCSNVLDSC